MVLFFLLKLFSSMFIAIINRRTTQAFAAELEANKDRLEKLEEDGSNIAEGKPERADEIEARLEELRKMWKELEVCTNSKEKTLFEAHKAELLAQVSILLRLRLRRFDRLLTGNSCLSETSC